MRDTGKVILSFSADEAGQWVKVNDSVMGGISRSEMRFTADNTALFEGTVSLQNYGGFASVRTHPRPYQLGGYDGLTLRVRGDGKRFKLRLRTNASVDGIAYQSGFDTRPDVWTTLQVPFAAFVPVYRGRTLTGIAALNPAEIQQIGFLIADKQQGPFRLEIDWIGAYSETEKSEGKATDSPTA
jgi:monofunctional biosynthetic peptidoglycan transglycosylase